MNSEEILAALDELEMRVPKNMKKKVQELKGVAEGLEDEGMEDEGEEELPEDEFGDEDMDASMDEEEMDYEDEDLKKIFG